MKRLAFSAISISAAMLLAGCSLLYPNWGTTQKPSDPETTTSSPTSTPTESPSETPSETATPKVVQKATLNIIQSGVDTANGELYVVAEVTNAVEDGGTCTLDYSSGSFTKSVTVKAESNVHTTQCFPINLSLKSLPKGAGTFTITYQSEGYKGTSAPNAVAIP
jgi:PBP1b-binding outer membrane lipoprotein LpoB